MLIRHDTFSDDTQCLKSVTVTKFRGGLLIHEHYECLASTHIHLKGRAGYITDRSTAHNILLGAGQGTTATAYTEDESVCSTETTEAFDYRLIWCVTCDSQKDGIGSVTTEGGDRRNFPRRRWYDGDHEGDQLKLSLLKPLPLRLMVPLSQRSAARLQLVVSCLMARAINDFLSARRWWRRDVLVKVKWPNDLGFVDPSNGNWRKIGGVLADPLMTGSGTEPGSFIGVDCNNDLHLLPDLSVDESAAAALDLYFTVSLGLNVLSAPKEVGITASSLLELLSRASDLDAEPKLIGVPPLNHGPVSGTTSSDGNLSARTTCSEHSSIRHRSLRAPNEFFAGGMSTSSGGSECLQTGAEEFLNLKLLEQHILGCVAEQVDFRALLDWAKVKHVFAYVDEEIDCIGEDEKTIMWTGQLRSINLMEGCLEFDDGKRVTPRSIRKHGGPSAKCSNRLATELTTGTAAMLEC